MALDVFGRDVTMGEDGFIGKGGGARSGSELSHLFPLLLVVTQANMMLITYIGTNARPPSEEAEC